MSSWLEMLKPGSRDARARVVFFPHAGASAFSYHRLANRLPNWLECIGVEYPGRGMRQGEALVSHVPTLGASAAEAIAAASNLPCILFGHSLGSFVAHEAARRLALEEANRPKLLVVSAQRSPDLEAKPPYVRDMDDRALAEEIAQLGGLPRAIADDADSMRMLLPVLRSDAEACESYRSLEVHRCDFPIFAYGGSDDRDVTHDDLSAWANWTRRTWIRRIFPGTHFYFVENEAAFLSCLLTDISAVLERAATP